jgi:hypothetical protein
MLKYFFLVTICILNRESSHAINYYSLTSGDWDDDFVWLGGTEPGNNIGVGDTVFILSGHNINATDNITVEGALFLESGSTYSGNKTMDIELTGTLDNQGLVSLSQDVHNDGYIFNRGQGEINIETIHNDGYICNSGIIRLQPGEIFDHHGGLIECCGIILCDELKIHENTAAGYTASLLQYPIAPGVILCQDICSTDEATDPIIDIDGTNYTTTVAITNPEPDQSIMDDDSTLFCGPFSTPVELVSFVGVNVPKGNQLIWQTASEKDNSHFELLRAFDNSNFEVIGKVEGNGTTIELSNYSFLDVTSPFGTSYYKLVQVNTDGVRTSSDIISIERSSLSSSVQLISVWPNPFQNLVHYEIQDGNMGQLTVTDYLGRVLWYQEVSFSAVKGKIDLSELQSGTYLLTFSSVLGQTQSQRIIKRR